MESKDNITCKVVLVGESGVGKTCIIQRYVNNDFNENTYSTTASTYTNKIVDYKQYNKSILLDIWDTAGQELYRAISQNFYLNASIGILVYDVRNRESFEALKDYWYERLKQSGEENMVFGVAGNKCDLFREEKVSEEEGKNFAESIGAIFYLTSCKESIGIDDLFEECGKQYIKKNELVSPNDKGKEKIVLNYKNSNNNNSGKKKKFC